MNPGELERNLRRLADLAARCRELGEQVDVALADARAALCPPVDPADAGADRADLEVAFK